MSDALLANGRAADLWALATRMTSGKQEEIRKIAPYTKWSQSCTGTAGAAQDV